jgi:hypothetical protein
MSAIARAPVGDHRWCSPTAHRQPRLRSGDALMALLHELNDGLDDRRDHRPRSPVEQRRQVAIRDGLIGRTRSTRSDSGGAREALQ